jgi:hypothetical protein
MTSLPNCGPYHPVCCPVTIVFPRDGGVYTLPTLTNPLYPPNPPSNPPAKVNQGVVFHPVLLSMYSPAFCPPYAPAYPVAVEVIAGIHPTVPADNTVSGIALRYPAV